MALRNEHQKIDPENVIPSRDPDKALARINREIRNGAIADLVDLRAALDSTEYRRIPQKARDELEARFA